MKPRSHRDIRSDRKDREHLFGAFLGLAVLMLLARLRILGPNSRPYLALLAYQDIFVCALIIWLFDCLLALSNPGWRRRVLIVTGWTCCLLIAAFTALNVVVFISIQRPLTHQLVSLTYGVRGVQASIDDARVLVMRNVAAAFLTVVLISELLWRRTPALLKLIRKVFVSGIGISLVLIYYIAAHAWVAQRMGFSRLSENAEWSLLSWYNSYDQPKFVDHPIPATYMRDFLPPRPREHRNGKRDKIDVWYTSPSPTRPPLNVLLVVMESVGARRLGLYGAPYDDTPNLVRLASHALVFNHIYVSKPNTSSAMAALFRSVYPELDLQNIPRRLPTLTIEGLPTVLARHGYRTAFIHSGALDYDQEGAFLSASGFEQIISENRDYDSPRDAELLKRTQSWLSANHSKPFFLTIWTQDTHHPYLVQHDHDYHVGDPSLNRYLNSIRSTDDLIGQLAQLLKQLNLSDNTLLVVTGDHGEAFGEHGQRVHGFTVYDEEVRIPLIIVNPRLFSHRETFNIPGRQIDIAPTLLAILNHEIPAQWQGAGLFDRHRPRRIYLFAADDNFCLGIIDGPLKYIYDFTSGHTELYSLSDDPYEQRTLSNDPRFSAQMAIGHLRLEAWLSFQNRYLNKFVGGSGAN
jgi:arylsulfatase A-like enzyme